MKRYFISKECYYNIYKTGKRTIYAPNKSLKLLQRLFLKTFDFYNKKYLIKNVAEVHCNKKWILKIDINDFYNSISSEQIKNTLETLIDLNNYKRDNFKYIYRLCTVSHKIPTGAVTSPFIVNFFMNKMDFDIKNLCGPNVSYSRYMDDLFFSADSKYLLNYIEIEVTKLLKLNGFNINKEKLAYISENKKQEILGLLVNNKRVCLSKEKKQKYRALFYNHLKTYNLTKNVKKDKKINGHLAYIKSVDIKFYNKMCIYISNLLNRFDVTDSILVKTIYSK